MTYNLNESNVYQNSTQKAILKQITEPAIFTFSQNLARKEWELEKHSLPLSYLR